MPRGVTMAKRWIGAIGTIVAVLAFAGQAHAQGRVTSENFVVDAPTQEMAREFSELAENYRKSKAIEWLGKEMPPYSKRCPLKVIPQAGGAGGFTQFMFDDDHQGSIRITQNMEIKGAIERMKHSVLPHEITHTIFAYHFRRSLPRWADEGGSVYSEDELEHARHDRMCRDFLNGGDGFPLRRLFGMYDYPHDVMVLYAQGFSVTSFVIEKSDRQGFLRFVGTGIDQGWDEAAKTIGYRNVSEMEKAWLDSMRKSRSGIAREKPQPREDSLTSTTRTRSSAQIGRPVLDPPQTIRGQSPRDDQPKANPTLGWTPPVAALGDPEPISRRPAPIRPVSLQRHDEPNNNNTPPPPVILFPPEPLSR